MGIDELMRDPFFASFIKILARMAGEWLQEKAPQMTNDQLYASANFLPTYNEERDYSEKEEGYTCKTSDGIVMRLTSTTSLPMALSENDTVGEGTFWRKCWSTDPMKARPFETVTTSPYNEGECCLFEGEVYRATDNMVIDSPEDDPSCWEKVTNDPSVDGK